MKKIAVLGANGHTAQFVIDELISRGLEILPATRDGRLRRRDGSQTDCAAVDLTDASSIEGVLRNADAVINCAGPFLDTALQTARAAILSGIPYLDVTAEQAAAASLFTELDEQARKSGTTVVPAMGFFGGLADMLAAYAARGAGPVRSTDVAVALDSWHPTDGTRLTGKRNTHTRAVVKDGVLMPVEDTANRRWDFGPGFGDQEVALVPLSEIVLINRHISAHNVRSWMNLKPLSDLADTSTSPPVPTDSSGRSSQRFCVEIALEEAEGDYRRIRATGQDIYAVTAPLVVSACAMILEGRTTGLTGVRAPGEVFDPAAFFETVGPRLQIHTDA
ncbi:saccharopine dehydrogenase NADP-binding domain-containing protein [Qipengyuania qiaonensis]|uniref:Saccharopine dehydrogenase NADP-binding domain-containing protein n=1 Tax=Qipengyuania qiaonensis TaxID=2867240 RepID=A0ABS7J461_9SPHN|nr:saccharopine dehydrogenase NADP-binding domain-containing protein [Qipengyuania qiaonensis]MBX7482109.1 saccharopine dehydrogenase NADP-binding domain-containing protein [Qipengyuania qiaonensis]